jgi:hypothetical protein
MANTQLPWPSPPSSGGGIGGGNISQSHQQSQQQSTNQSYGSQQSQSYIPDYSQTPILNQIASYARDMAPQVYNWGMEQWANNKGNIDSMMRAALSYASPQRVANEMGMAEAGVQQGAEAGRQSAIRDLESYGIDPSSGRYQQLDNASRVMSGAAAAGAGNQQRMATEAQGNAMQQQALSAGMQNTAMGYGASNAMNQLLGTGMQLKYSPLGTSSSGVSGSAGQSTGFSQSESASGPAGMFAAGGDVGYQNAGNGGDDATTGGFVSQELSPSAGSQVDDVQARLNVGEFVIPRDVSDWLGKSFFYKLMAKTRKDRAMLGDGGGETQSMDTGYGAN